MLEYKYVSMGLMYITYLFSPALHYASSTLTCLIMIRHNIFIWLKMLSYSRAWCWSFSYLLPLPAPLVLTTPPHLAPPPTSPSPAQSPKCTQSLSSTTGGTVSLAILITLQIWPPPLSGVASCMMCWSSPCSPPPYPTIQYSPAPWRYLAPSSPIDTFDTFSTIRS